MKYIIWASWLLTTWCNRKFIFSNQCHLKNKALYDIIGIFGPTYCDQQQKVSFFDYRTLMKMKKGIIIICISILSSYSKAYKEIHFINLLNNSRVLHWHLLKNDCANNLHLLSNKQKIWLTIPKPQRNFEIKCCSHPPTKKNDLPYFFTT